LAVAFCLILLTSSSSRDRKGVIDQSFKKNKNPVIYEHGSLRIKPVDSVSKPVDPIVLPFGVIDRLKQMDPKAVADLLLK